jgi:hypothetical protein
MFRTSTSGIEGQELFLALYLAVIHQLPRILKFSTVRIAPARCPMPLQARAIPFRYNGAPLLL